MNLYSGRFKFFTWLFWLILFLMFSFYELVKTDFTLTDNLLYWPGAYFLSLAILTPFTIYTFRSSLRKNSTLIHIPISFLFGFLHHWLSGIIILLGERLFVISEHFTISSLLNFLISDWYLALQGILWYWFIIICLYLLYYIQVHHEKQKELIDSRSQLKSSSLETLSSQLNPHFLFNAMNNISMLIRKNETKKAISMTAALSNLLRRAMSARSAQITRLSEEIDFLQQYIDLEMLRHEENVSVHLDIQEDIGEPKIPQMLIQPLVENAFKHGVNDQPEGAQILITIQKQDDRLILEVYNTGIFNTSWNLNDRGGIGLHNTIHRLRQQYGSDYTLQIKEEHEGVRILITIPYEE